MGSLTMKRTQTGSIVIGYNGLLAVTLLVTSLTSFLVGQLHLPRLVESPFSSAEIAGVEEKTIDASEDAFKTVWQTLHEIDVNAKKAIYSCVGNFSDL